MNLPGWEKILLYPPPLEPAFAYVSPSALARLPTVLIDAGIHGDEPAPILAVQKSASIFQKLSQTYGFIIVPITNPLGYKNHTRYIDSDPDWHNSHSVGDMGHVMGWYPTYFARYISPITNIKLILDLHEDDLTTLPPGAYVYPMGTHADPKPILATLQKHTTIISNCQTRFGENIVNGIVTSVPNASFPEYLLHLNPRASAYTMETTTNLQLNTRIMVHEILLTNSISLI